MGARDEVDATGRAPARGLRYRRVLLKLSGEALMGNAAFGIDTAVLGAIAEEIRAADQIVPIIIMPVAVAVYGLLTNGLHSPFPEGLLLPTAKVHIPVIVFFLFSARHCDQIVVKVIDESCG